MRVWIAYQGEYSARCTIGVFSSREKAAALFDPPSEENDIECFDVDVDYGSNAALGTSPHMTIGDIWCVTIDLPSGESSGAYRVQQQRRPANLAEVELYPKERPETIYVRAARSQELAIKLAIEAHHEWLRSQAITPSLEPAPGHPQTHA